jgi:hypothetical protein
MKRLEFLSNGMSTENFSSATGQSRENIPMFKVTLEEDENQYINKTVTQIVQKDGKNYNTAVAINRNNKIVNDAKSLDTVVERKYIGEVSYTQLSSLFGQNGINVEFSSDAKGYKVLEKNGTTITENYLFNKVAFGDLFTNLQLVQTPTKPLAISTLWTYVAMPSDITLCIESYKNSLVNICNQTHSIESVFGSIDTIYKHTGYWSYWDKNGKNYSFDKVGSLSSKEGLLVKSEHVRTLQIPYDITKEIVTDLIDFYQKGWFLVYIPFEMTLSEITHNIALQNKTLKHIFRFKNNVWEIYAPHNDNNYPATLQRIDKLNSDEVVWIEVE